jgi:hypothetical protein
MDMMNLAQKQRIRQEEEQEEDQEQEQEESVIHKIQPIHGSRSMVIVLPKKLTTQLGIRKGDYARFSISDNKLILEKVQD